MAGTTVTLDCFPNPKVAWMYNTYVVMAIDFCTYAKGIVYEQDCSRVDQLAGWLAVSLVLWPETRWEDHWGQMAWQCRSMRNRRILQGQKTLLHEGTVANRLPPVVHGTVCSDGPV